jgi:hypothetical protein
MNRIQGTASSKSIDLSQLNSNNPDKKNHQFTGITNSASHRTETHSDDYPSERNPFNSYGSSSIQRANISNELDSNSDSMDGSLNVLQPRINDTKMKEHFKIIEDRNHEDTAQLKNMKKDFAQVETEQKNLRNENEFLKIQLGANKGVNKVKSWLEKWLIKNPKCGMAQAMLKTCVSGVLMIGGAAIVAISIPCIVTGTLFTGPLGLFMGWGVFGLGIAGVVGGSLLFSESISKYNYYKCIQSSPAPQEQPVLVGNNRGIESSPTAV